MEWRSQFGDMMAGHMGETFAGEDAVEMLNGSSDECASTTRSDHRHQGSTRARSKTTATRHAGQSVFVRTGSRGRDLAAPRPHKILIRRMLRGAHILAHLLSPWGGHRMTHVVVRLYTKLESAGGQDPRARPTPARSWPTYTGSHLRLCRPASEPRASPSVRKAGGDKSVRRAAEWIKAKLPDARSPHGRSSRARGWSSSRLGDPKRAAAYRRASV